MTTKIVPPVLIMAVLILGTGCARPDWIEQTLVTVDVTGTWRSTEGGLFQLDLEQEGAQVKGVMVRLGIQGWGRISGRIEGAVSGDVFRFKQVSGPLANLQGEMTVAGEEMSG